MPIPLLPPAGPIDGPGVVGEILHDGQVTLGPITFGVTDSFGVEWILEQFSGWVDRPASTGAADQKPNADGAWLSPAYNGPRILGLTGSAIANDWDAAEEAMLRLNAALPLSVPEDLTVATTRRLLTTKVRIDGDPLAEIVDGWARFSLSLIADDPRKYDFTTVSASTGLPSTTGGLRLSTRAPFRITADVVSGQLTVANAGNTDTAPVFTVTGPCPAFTISHLQSGSTLSYPEAVPTGRTVVIDTAARTALLDGAPRYVTGAWFTYAPGTNDVVFGAGSYDAGALLTSTHRNAYL